MITVRYEGQTVATVSRGGISLEPDIDELPIDDPRRRWIGCMAFFAYELAHGRLPGDYSDARAVCFARRALVPDADFLAHAAGGVEELSRRFGVPASEVARQRR